MAKSILFVLLAFCAHVGISYVFDKPCAGRAANTSLVCICNTTYCDEITRERPENGKFFAYTTSQAGLRFQKSVGLMQIYFDDPHASEGCRLLELNPYKRFQTIEGFGGAVTDSASMNWANLQNNQLKKYMIDSYFGYKGIGYNMMRIPIGGCDFSVRPYAYNEQPANDAKLSNFSLSYEDDIFKIPMIRACMEAATAPIHSVVSTWSPPLWMKSPSQMSGLTRLRKEYFQTYADYHLKFIQKYAQNGIPTWAVTITNEPLSGVMSLGHNNRLGWTTKSLGKWITNNLGPTLRNSGFNVKILTGDDMRFTIPVWLNTVLMETPEARDYIDGVAVHFYYDQFSPPSLLVEPLEDYPEKFTLYTEACNGVGEDLPHVLLGSWERAVKYIKNIIEDLNYNSIGWIDWNLCLDINGGPNYIENFVDSPIIVFPERGEFVKQPMFYGLGHFAKFVPRGSQRIEVNKNNCCRVDSVAFVTPENTIVTVLHNDDEKETEISVKLGYQVATVKLPPKSIATVEFPNTV